MTRRDRDHHRLRTLLAQECARLMTEEGIKDFRTAKRKAALRLAVSDRAVLPDNTEIEQAVIEHQRLFHAQQQPAHLRQLRRQALDAMRFLAPFRPKLVGSVLNGTAGLHADIQLHLFADTPSEVLLFLMEHRIPLETAERRLTLNNGNQISLPVFRFKAGDAPLDLTVFATLSEREPPRSPVDGRPLRRAGPGEVEALLASDLPQGLC
ncbi:MAG TPA: hypothetical protein PLU26_12615 [Candidatus Competibacter sp.]|nr:hypothetical protein [Candidatus Competibacter sp.]